jgi:hypothetical protein
MEIEPNNECKSSSKSSYECCASFLKESKFYQNIDLLKVICRLKFIRRISPDAFFVFLYYNVFLSCIVEEYLNFRYC